MHKQVCTPKKQIVIRAVRESLCAVSLAQQAGVSASLSYSRQSAVEEAFFCYVTYILPGKQDNSVWIYRINGKSKNMTLNAVVEAVTTQTVPKKHPQHNDEASKLWYVQSARSLVILKPKMVFLLTVDSLIPMQLSAYNLAREELDLSVPASFAVLTQYQFPGSYQFSIIVSTILKADCWLEVGVDSN
ncbi:hypothetical protein AAES_55033 [Amazona aestiva]|uniref:Uncharacterized protein n=1 Tax=Amazona aestiva TaxID=12930 RepID=A0A0Q3RE50_AMAAE|nr:hypothetical protein AAES_55033 [Amazona aestiva]